MARGGKKKGQSFDDSDEEINLKNNNKKQQDSDDDIPQPVKKGGKQQQQQKKGGNKKQDSEDEQDDIPQPVKKGGKQQPQKKGGKQQQDSEEEPEDLPQPVKKGGKQQKKGGKKQESEDEEEPEDLPQPVKKGGKQQPQKKGGKQQQDSEDEQDDIPQPVKKGGKPVGKKGGKQQQESEDEQEEDIPQPVKKGGKQQPQKKGGKKQESEDEEEPEDLPQPVKKGGKQQPAGKKDNKKGGKKQQESEDEEEMEESEEEDIPQPVKKGGKQQPAGKKDNKKGGKKQQESEEEEEEEEIPQPVKKNNKKDKKSKGKHIEEEPEEEEEEEEEPIEEPVKKGKKDKKDKKSKGKHVEEEEEPEEEPEEEEPVKKGKKDKKGKKSLEDDMAELSIKSSKKSKGKKGKHVEEEPEEEEPEEDQEEEEEEEEEEKKPMTLAEAKALKKAKKLNKIDKKKEKAIKKRQQEEEEDDFEAAKKKQQEEIDYDNVDIEDVPGKDPPQYVHLKTGEGLRSKIGNDIKIDSITLSVPGKILLQNASLTLAYGQKYGFVGRNGIGKSTLVKKIAMRDEITIAPHLRVLYVEQEVTGDEKTPLECVLAADLERSWLMEEEKILSELEKENPNWQFDPRQKRNYTLRDIYDRLKEIESDKASIRASNILVGLGFTLEEISNKKSKDYSGGWRMRIALARALFCKPEVLLLDEPSNHLDLHACVWLEKYLNTWDRTLLVVSHEASFLNEVVDNIIHIHDQRLDQYRGNYDAFMKQRAQNQRSKEKEKDKQDRKLKKMNEFITKNKNNTNAKQAASRERKMKKEEIIEIESEEKSLVVDFPDPDHLVPPLLVFKHVDFGYEGKPLMFKNLEIGVDMDSKIALVGMNGVGKSTLMKLMNGDLHESNGYIERNRKCRIARFSQHFVDQLDVSVSSIEYFQTKFSNPPIQQIRNHLGRFGITGSLPLHKINTLSGGQKSRVILAELAWAEPHILLLDEPTNHLDIDAIEALADGINKFQGGVVLISHNQHLINLIAEQIWVVRKDGTIYLYPGTFIEYKEEISRNIETMTVTS